jgi:hypothetical protein
VRQPSAPKPSESKTLLFRGGSTSPGPSMYYQKINTHQLANMLLYSAMFANLQTLQMDGVPLWLERLSTYCILSAGRHLRLEVHFLTVSTTTMYCFYYYAPRLCSLATVLSASPMLTNVSLRGGKSSIAHDNKLEHCTATVTIDVDIHNPHHRYDRHCSRLESGLLPAMCARAATVLLLLLLQYTI